MTNLTATARRLNSNKLRAARALVSTALAAFDDGSPDDALEFVEAALDLHACVDHLMLAALRENNRGARGHKPGSITSEASIDFVEDALRASFRRRETAKLPLAERRAAEIASGRIRTLTPVR